MTQTTVPMGASGCTVGDAIRVKLTTALAPVRLEIVDESHLHAGHVGARPGGETHFRVHVISPAFAGKTRVARQRYVYDLLAAELAGPVHALSVRAETPEEAKAPRSGRPAPT
jgi:BolA family transcriptional regulator, general stress-responsive regulator